MDSAENTPPREIRDAQVQALKLALDLAKGQESPLAVDHWNAACRRIQNLIQGEIQRLSDENEDQG